MICILVLGVAASAGQKKKKKKEEKVSKPGNATWLVKDKLWYHLHVPKPYEPKDWYTLVVVTPHRADRASESFREWVKRARLDGIFMATLNFPRHAKEKQPKRIYEMVAQVCKKYKAIDTKSLVLLGVGGGANTVLQVAGAYPRVFSTAIALSPNRIPELSKIKPSRKRLASSTRVYLTYDPKNRELRKKLTDLRRQLSKRGCYLTKHGATALGLGKASEEELALALKALRSRYPQAKRTKLAEVWRKEADKKKQQEEAKKKKLAEAKAELDKEAQPKKKPGQKGEKPNPDDLLLEGRDLIEKRQLGAAFKVFQRLAKLYPNSDYATFARKRIKELKADPDLAQAIADEAAGPQCSRWLTRARTFLRNNMRDKAIADLKKIISKFPKSSFAEEARRELKKLGGM